MERHQPFGSPMSPASIAQQTETFERALAESESRHGQDHPDTIPARAALAYAYAYASADRANEAVAPAQAVAWAEAVVRAQAVVRAEGVALARANLAIAERGSGPADPRAISARCDLGFLLLSSGKAAEALPYFLQAAANAETALGPGHPEALMARYLVARARVVTGEVSEAVLLHERTGHGRAPAPPRRRLRRVPGMEPGGILVPAGPDRQHAHSGRRSPRYQLRPHQIGPRLRCERPIRPGSHAL